MALLFRAAGCRCGLRRGLSRLRGVEIGERQQDRPGSTGLSRRGGFRAGIAALDLRPSSPVFQVSGRFFFCRFTNLDMVGHRRRARAFGQARGYTLVLNDVGLALEGGYTPLHVHLEFLGPDFRFLQGGRGFLFRFPRPISRPRRRLSPGPRCLSSRHPWRQAWPAGEAWPAFRAPPAARITRIAATGRRLRILS